MNEPRSHIENPTPKRWWWPYIHPIVVRVCIVLLIAKVALGSAAGIGTAAQGHLMNWIWLLNGWGLTYDFGWAELTEGEGSLFWIVAVSGYSEGDAKNIAKFPLYPAVARSLWDLSGHAISLPFLLSLIHSLMVWAGVAETYRFWERYRAGYGRRAVFWCLVSPLFVFHVWLASYMEPGFIALMWLSLTLEANRRWAASSAALLCLTLLQPSGVILACFIGLRRLHQWYKGVVPASAVLWALIPGLAWGVWIIFTSLWFDRALAPYAFQAEWGRTVYRWPWDRWTRFNHFALEDGFTLGHALANVSIVWIVLGYVWGGWLWLKLPHHQKSLLGRTWVLPLFTFMVVVIPFSTLVAGVQRYSLTSLIAVWPLLFSESMQAHPRFQRLEKIIWAGSLFICFMILFAFVTGYNHIWGLYF